MQVMHLQLLKVMMLKNALLLDQLHLNHVETSGGSAPIEKMDAADEVTVSKFIKREEVKSDRPELGTARIVISGGRGMQSGDNFKLIKMILLIN